MEKLFFIAVIPPKPLAEDITAIKQDFADRFESRRALRIMPHITLAPPFKLFEGKRKGLLEWFEKLTFSISAFEVTLNGFGTFDKPKSPVVFVKPEPSKNLDALQKELMGRLSNLLPKEKAFTEEDFHAHMTVSYRDLSVANFKKAWQEYQSKDFSASFTVESFHLLEHDGTKWNVIATKNL